MFRHLSIGLVLVLIVSGCAAKHVRLEDRDGGRWLFFKKRTLDGHGRPRFAEPLEERPAGKGGTYIAVLYRRGLPVLSRDISAGGIPGEDIRQTGGTSRSWRGTTTEDEDEEYDPSAGVPGEYEKSQKYRGVETMRDVLEEEEDDEEESPLSDFFGDVLRGTVGFLGGLVASSDHLASYRNEVVLRSEAYECDTEGRLVRVRVFLPEGKYLEEQFNIIFRYGPDGDEPAARDVVPVPSPGEQACSSPAYT
jgi:hypothetical protein